MGQERDAAKPRMSAGAVIGVVSIAVTILSIPATIFVNAMGNDPMSDRQSVEPPSVTNTTDPLLPDMPPDEPEPDPESEPEPESDSEAGSLNPGVDDLSSIAIEVERASNGYGYQIGDQLYALGTGDRLQLDISWVVTDVNGVQMRGGDCQIVVRLTGPDGAGQSRRFGECTGITQGFFDGWPEPITTAGGWDASVTDELTGLAASVSFTVAPDRDT